MKKSHRGCSAAEKRVFHRPKQLDVMLTSPAPAFGRFSSSPVRGRSAEHGNDPISLIIKTKKRNRCAHSGLLAEERPAQPVRPAVRVRIENVFSYSHRTAVDPNGSAPLPFPSVTLFDPCKSVQSGDSNGSEDDTPVFQLLRRSEIGKQAYLFIRRFQVV